ncbi:MAG: glycosyltransferase family 39 protein [Candidatus Hinthialibacter antarcticus]|nr:glycosyltransferase family 39 protein [Candidatus Hinthialibacter antarcticus]
MKNSTANENVNSQQSASQSAFHFCSEKRPAICLFILCGVLYFTWLNAEPLRTHIEANRVQASWEMLHSGDWVVPTLNGESYLAKPPLQYWVICLLALPWGEVTTFIARSLSALSILFTVWLLFHLAKAQLNARIAFFACVIFALSPLIFEKGPRAELEAPLTVAVAAAVFCLWKASQSSWMRWTLASGLALGCAALIKGPVPWLIFATAWAGLMVGTSNRKQAALSGALAVIVSLLCLAPWGLALLSRFGWEQLYETLYWEIFERTVSEREIIQEPFWYYIKSLAKGLFPWSLLAPGLYFLPWRSQQGRAFFCMIVGWAIGSALLFSFFSGKETRYLISTYPAWALLLAWGWSALPAEGWPNAYRNTMDFAAQWMLPAIVYVGALIVMLIFHPATTYAIAYLFYGLLIIGVMNIGVAVRRNRPRWLLFALFITLLGFKGFWSESYMNERQHSYPYAKMGHEIAEYLNEGEPLVSVGIYRAFVQYPIKHPFQHVSAWEEFKALEQDNKLEGRYLLITQKKMPLDAVHDYPLMNRWRTKRNEFLLFKIDGSVEP